MRPEPKASLPVAVIMSRKQVTHGRWVLPVWEAVGAVAGESVAGQSREPVLIRSEDKIERFLFRGFRIELHRDSAEDYWFNLAGNSPALYVLCHEDPGGDVVPFSVTVDPNEASSGMEGDDKVFAVPMPPEVFRQIEEFVITYYVPRERGKRKRKDWSREPGSE